MGATDANASGGKVLFEPATDGIQFYIFCQLDYETALFKIYHKKRALSFLSI